MMSLLLLTKGVGPKPLRDEATIAKVEVDASMGFHHWLQDIRAAYSRDVS